VWFETEANRLRFFETVCDGLKPKLSETDGLKRFETERLPNRWFRTDLKPNLNFFPLSHSDDILNLYLTKFILKVRKNAGKIKIKYFLPFCS
jgi:hypothetical protein